MSTHNGQHRVAVVQHASVWLNRAATLQRAVELVAEAASNGARLVAFPETFIAGYPEWVWEIAPSREDILEELYARLVSQSVDVASDDLSPLFEAARAHNVTIVCGINECDRAGSGTTLYNTVVIISPQGQILNKHRKLVPTYAERMVWSMGDASQLRPVETPSGKVGALICWENYMPLARFAMYAQGVQIYVAPTWSRGDRWIATMRHIAFEGRCWVLGCGNIMSVEDVPDDIPGRDYLIDHPDGWINAGDSVIVSPDGEIVAGPLNRERGILYAECDPARVVRERYQLDVAGHYSRPDIFHLQMRRHAGNPIEIIPDLQMMSDAVSSGTNGHDWNISESGGTLLATSPSVDGRRGNTS